jgi:MraZ protein
LSNRGIFRGYALNQIDAAKGRVAIPAGMRATIEANSQAKFLVLSKHDEDPCLIGYDREYSPLLHSKLEEREREERQAGRAGSRYNINRSAFGIVEDVSYDTSGRFIIPPFMKKKARLDDLAFFIAVGDTFEIWNPHVLLETPGVDEEVKELVRYLLEEREAA